MIDKILDSNFNKLDDLYSVIMEDTPDILGEYKATGIVPRFYHKFFQEGIVLPESVFQPD